MSSRNYRPFTTKAHISLRYVIRLTEDGYEVDCIDAGAIGVGETQQDALKSLVESLEALFETSGKKLKMKAREDDELLYARLVGRQKVDDGSVVAWGVVERVEVVATAAAKRHKRPIREGAAFEVTQLARAA